MSKFLNIPTDTPEQGKYQPGKAKEYLVELMDGKKAWLNESPLGDFFSILEGSNLEHCSVSKVYKGVGLLDLSRGLCMFYATEEKLQKIGRPIFIGKIYKQRKHSVTKVLAEGWKDFKLPENKLFFVTNRWEPTGFYVIAQSSQAARYLAYSDLDCDYIDSRARRVKIKEEWRLGEYTSAGVVIYPGDHHILGHLDIEYDEPEE